MTILEPAFGFCEGSCAHQEAPVAVVKTCVAQPLIHIEYELHLMRLHYFGERHCER
jgi:hypothetical protein